MGKAKGKETGCGCAVCGALTKWKEVSYVCSPDIYILLILCNQRQKASSSSSGSKRR